MDTHHTSLGEATPLLGSNSGSPESIRQNHPKRAVALVSLLILLLAGSGSLCSLPQTRLVEDVLCHRYYQDSYDSGDPIDERLCKNDIIQSDLAYILGAYDTIEAVTGLIVVLPYGILADRIGRRLVLALSSVGTILTTLWVMMVLHFWQSISIYSVMLAPTLQVLGGGTSVLLAMVYSLIADAVSESTRVDSFSQMTVASLAGGFLGSLTAARLMQITSPWIPFTASLFGVGLGTSLAVFLPESRHGKPLRHHTTDASVNPPPTDQTSLLASVRIQVGKTFSRLRYSVSVLPSTSSALVLLTFLSNGFVVLGGGHFFVQYVSKRFHWTLAEAGYLVSIRGITSIFVLLIGLPGLGKLLTSSSMPVRLSPARKDMVLARASAITLTTGALLMAFSSVIPVTVVGLITMTFGGGIIPLCKSILATFVDAGHFSTIYTLVSLVETVSTLFSGPSLAGLFSRGMKLGGLWLGLPYFGVSLLCAFTVILLVLAKLPSQEVQGGEEDEVNQERDE